MASRILRAGALLAAAFALALVYLRLPESGARSDRPLCERCNVILISFDTVRADHLGTYGYARPTSPNVDDLAKDSIVFERAISQAPWTLPAHGSMLSGLYPRRLGVVRYPASRVLPVDNPVLPEVFAAAGYATAGFTGGGFVSSHYGFDRGFDIYPSAGRRFEHNLDQTIDWLRSNKDRPFFLFFHGYDAHRPYYSKAADKKEMGLAPGASSEQGRFCLRDDRARPDDQRLDEILRYYDASIHHGDRAIGVLLRTIKQLKLMDDTVILLTSDHGEEFFEHGNCDHVRFLYEESVRVPYMIWVPGFSKGGRRVDGLIPASISVARTLLDLVGIQHSMPGVTLLPILEKKQKGFPVVYSEADSPVGSLGSRGGVLAITKTDTKLISYTDEGTDEAYLLDKDPLEKEILPERHEAYFLRQTLRAWADSLKALAKPERGARGEVGDVLEEEPGTGGESGSGGEEEPSSEAPSAVPGAGSGDSGDPDGSDESDRPDGSEEEMVVPKDVEESLKSLGYLE